MKYSDKDINFIIYNNRSPILVEKFIPKGWNPFKIIEIEKKLNNIKDLYQDLTSDTYLNKSDLDLDESDIIFEKEDLESLSTFIKSDLGKFSENEKEFLKKRRIPHSIQSELIGLSNFNKESLKIIGATCHPILKRVLLDGIEDGGICIPLWDGDKITNIAIRRCSDVGKLKYTLSIPDLPVWGLDDLEEGDEVWICEGIFDMMALRERGIKSCSVSSAMWSSLQLYQLLEKKPGCIVIVADNDRIGYLVATKLDKFFKLNNIPSLTIHTKLGKDMAEYFWELGGNGDDLENINITRDLIGQAPSNTFNIIDYWKNRKF
jgi:hypothetical protein